MDRQRLNKSIQQLHDELGQVDSVDESERQVLEQLRSDIQDVLKEKEGHDEEGYKLLSARLQGSVAKFEASHPTLTMLMGQTIDMLAQMGI
ncbi:MAG: DUF4404 family protein [Acidobacteriota bacterium]